MKIEIKSMTEADWPQLREIYREGIATGNATFETETPSWEKWDAGHKRECRLVACDQQLVTGWAALSVVSTRLVYAGIAEVSICVAASGRGRGIGKLLLAALIEESERYGLWTLQGGIFPENVASIALHKSCGFRGVRQRPGKLGDKWKDGVLLERRSLKVGV